MHSAHVGILSSHQGKREVDEEEREQVHWLVLSVMGEDYHPRSPGKLAKKNPGQAGVFPLLESTHQWVQDTH